MAISPMPTDPVGCQKIEMESDALLRDSRAFAGPHPDCYSELQTGRRRRSKFAREQSIEDMCEAASIEIPAPPPDMARLIDRALRAFVDRQDAHIWALHELGWSQRKIADALNVCQAYVGRRLSKIRAKIASHIEENEQAYLCFRGSMSRRMYTAPARRPPLPQELQHARMVLEAQGLETWILPEEPRRVVVIDPSAADDRKEKRLTYKSVIRLARVCMFN